MPTAAEKLRSDSSWEQVRESISSCVSQMADEHPDWDNDRRVAACHEMARDATGKEISKRSFTRRRVR